MKIFHQLIGLALLACCPKEERGLSQSTENAILLVGAVGVAMIVVTVVKEYVTNNLPK